MRPSPLLLSLLRQPSTKRFLSSTPTRCRPSPSPSHGSKNDSNILELAYTRHDPPAPAPAPRSSPDGSTSESERCPIIVMHGLFGSQRNNRTFSKVLAKQLLRPVYTVDLRNHGASPHDPVHNYDAMCADVEGFVAQHKIHRPILIGHSMGAKIAMACALRSSVSSSPSAVSYSGIVPVDNAPVDAALKSDFGVYVRGMQEIEARSRPLTKQSDADKILEKYEQEVSIRQFLLTNLVKASALPSSSSAASELSPEEKRRLKFRVPLSTLAKSLDAMADFPFKGDTSDDVVYRGPTLVIRGGNSRYVADETLPAVGRFFPRFELVDVPGAGHWVISEKFDECVEAVVEWCRRVVDQE